MPRIRKKTSNRLKVHDREKLKKKVKETKRKKAKLAKKNPQWKSKKTKDPGIPNDFPYKDQLLAEVQAERRLIAEEKQRKKEEKQKALANVRAIARGEIIEDEGEDDEDDAVDADDGSLNDDEDEALTSVGKKDLNVGAESIAALSAKTLDIKLKKRPRTSTAVTEEAEEAEEDVPVLFNRDLPTLGAVLEKADVVLEVLDARDPLACRSKHIEELAKEGGKKVLFVLSKIDRCPREAVTAWTNHLRLEHPTLLFRSASAFLPEEHVTQPISQLKKGKGKAKADDAVGIDSIISCLSEWAQEKGGDASLCVAVVGIANAGKSSLVNSLLKKSAFPIYTLSSSPQGPTTTELPQEISLEDEARKFTIIDTPGLSFIHDQEEEESILQTTRAQDILLRSKGRIDRLKDSSVPIAHIVSRANTEDLMLMYSLPAFAKGDPTAFLASVARANQLVKKKGELDLTGAARIVLRDWNTGKLARYTTPTVVAPHSESSSNLPSHPTNTSLSSLYSRDDTILATLPTRKELRQKGGLVKLSPGSIDERKAQVEEGWAALEDSEAEDDDDVDGQEHGDEGMDVDDEEEKDEEEGEEDGSEEDEESQAEEQESSGLDEEDDEDLTPAQAPASHKQKRKRGLELPVPARPTKKVSLVS